MESTTAKDKVEFITSEEFWLPIQTEYIQKIADTDPADVYPSYNPGPTKPDGSMNFECHCVGHMVASPCGYEFREAITCQKNATDEEMKDGKCEHEMVAFMECVMRTQCFKTNDGPDEATK